MAAYGTRTRAESPPQNGTFAIHPIHLYYAKSSYILQLASLSFDIWRDMKSLRTLVNHCLLYFFIWEWSTESDLHEKAGLHAPFNCYLLLNHRDHVNNTWLFSFVYRTKNNITTVFLYCDIGEIFTETLFHIIEGWVGKIVTPFKTLPINTSYLAFTLHV